mmetsp:Transcript_21720/g.53597  ORF Transcript_21720/g.53597 Transcript_21720/m.53597 type:complete len:130 (+) Transcript_21720:2-391(+)
MPWAQRGPPKNKGQKAAPPTGDFQCLEGKTFVITGVLDSLERDECADYIKMHGGRVVGSVSGKVTHAVVGDDAGERKLKYISEKGVTSLTEDELFALVKSASENPETREPKKPEPKKVTKSTPTKAVTS